MSEHTLVNRPDSCPHGACSLLVRKWDWSDKHTDKQAITVALWSMKFFLSAAKIPRKPTL